MLVTNPSRVLPVHAQHRSRWLSCESDRHENNNSAQGAERITGASIRLTFCGDVDYYRFSAPADSLIRAELRTELPHPVTQGSGSSCSMTAATAPSQRASALRTCCSRAQQRARERLLYQSHGPETLNIGYDLYLERAVEGNNTGEQAERIELRRNEEIEAEGATRMDNNFVPECGHRDNEPRSAAADVVYALRRARRRWDLVAELRCARTVTTLSCTSAAPVTTPAPR